jgi:16S rRNA (cytidine1402-2'-O)-methyltransferase
MTLPTSRLSPGLYVVATPLGNLSDLSERAATCLRQADVVFAEDTRRTQGLLSHLGAKKPMHSLHAHNEHQRREVVLRALREGKVVALVSDAGTPAVSDPGALAVEAAHAEGFTVVPVAGPSALCTALSACGFMAGEAGVLFLGFLPGKGKSRRVALDRLLSHGGLGVVFEAPHRIVDTLQELAAAAPERTACLCRELTKLHEEIVRGTLAYLHTWAAGREVVGEITLVLGPLPPAIPGNAEVEADDGRIDEALRRCLAAGLSSRDASTAVAAVLELPRRRVYSRCLALLPAG